MDILLIHLKIRQIHTSEIMEILLQMVDLSISVNKQTNKNIHSWTFFM